MGLVLYGAMILAIIQAVLPSWLSSRYLMGLSLVSGMLESVPEVAAPLR